MKVYVIKKMNVEGVYVVTVNDNNTYVLGDLLHARKWRCYASPAKKLKCMFERNYENAEYWALKVIEIEIEDIHA